MILIQKNTACECITPLLNVDAQHIIAYTESISVFDLKYRENFHTYYSSFTGLKQPIKKNKIVLKITITIVIRPGVFLIHFF